MIIIGEKLNSSIKSVAGYIDKLDAGYIQDLAQKQAAAGADFLDVNAAAFLDRENELLPWLVKVVQEAVTTPLCIDSPNPSAIDKAFGQCQGKAILNSISCETKRYAEMIPMIKHYQSAIIALCMDDDGIPQGSAKRFEIAQRLVDSLTRDGVKQEDIYLDVMVQPIATDIYSGQVALDTVRKIKEHIPAVHITCGLSNVSFELPGRRLLNRSFTTALLAYGLDTLFIDPLDDKLMSSVYATQALLGQDEYCSEFISAYRKNKLLI